MANPENKQIPYESTQKDIRDAIESVATAIGGIAIPSADHVSYDNSGSGLSATDVQDAIDELSSEKADSSSLATVATSGDYDDLVNKPTIPTVNDATLTIQKNGSDVATFTANASSNVTANVTVPTTTSELTNNSDFVSDASYVHTDNNFTTAEKTKLSGIESGAEVNVQSDWNQTDNTKDDYIKNKPSSEVKTATDTFTTVNGGLLEECNIELVPVQDLHGYLEPWVGGSRKNKIPLTLANLKVWNTAGTWNNNIYTINAVTFTVNTDNGGNVTGIVLNGSPNINSGSILVISPLDSSNYYVTDAQYVINGCPSGGSSDTYYLIYWDALLGGGFDTGSGYSFTYKGNNVNIRIGIKYGYTANNLLFKPMIRLATESDPTFEPYSNICPISGHTEVDLQRDGKNKLPMTVADIKALNTGGTWSGNEYTHRGVKYTILTDSDGNIIGFNASGTASGGAANLSINAAVGLSNDNTYILNGCPSGGSIPTYSIAIADKDEQWSGPNYDIGSGSTLTNGVSKITISIANGTNIGSKDFYPMIRLSTESDPTFEPYLGHLYQVQIGSTVYGGYVDLVSGVMNVDGIVETFDGTDETWFKANGGTPNWYYFLNVNSNYLSKLICDTFNNANIINSNTDTGIGMTGAGTANAYIRIRTALGELSIPDWKTWLSNNNVHVYFPLATPQTIQLTPQQIETLVGQNNLSTPLDGQSIDSIEYREVFAFDDVEKVVSLRVPISMLGTDESGRATASQSYASGDYFYKDGYMCKALTSISAGATLTLNTNYSQGTLADILKAIENA